MSGFPFDLDPAEKACLGLIVLHVDETIESDFRRIFSDPSVALYVTRIPSGAEATPETLGRMEALAREIAGEWAGQEEKVDPTAMPFTRMANSALDKVTPPPMRTADGSMRYSGYPLANVCWKLRYVAQGGKSGRLFSCKPHELVRYARLIEG